MTDPTNLSELVSEPLTTWKNPPKLTDLKQDLQDAKPIHSNQVDKITEWLDNLNVTGKAKVKVIEGNSAVTPKLIRKQAEWRYAALSEPYLSRPDLFNVEPITWEDKKAALQNQLVLNSQFNTKIDKVNFIDTFVRAAVDEGTAIVRVGWEFLEEQYEEEVPDVQFVVDPTFAPMHQQLMQLMQESPSQFDTDVPEELKTAHQMTMDQGVPIRPNVIGKKKVTKTRTICNKPTAEVCNYRNVVVDPTCLGNIDKANFLVYSFESSLGQLTKDGKYKNLNRINVNTNSPLAEPDYVAAGGNSGFNFSDEPRKKIVVHEYWGFWDIDGSGVTKPIVAAWVGNTIIRLEENPFPDKKIPFVIVQYLPVRGDTYGEPDGVLIEDNQKIAGAVTRGMIDLMGKSANGQTGIRKDMLDATNKRKFDQGKDYEFNANIDPRQGVHMHTYPEIPQSAQFMLNLQNMEAESLTGVKSFSGGISGAGLGDVAVGVRGALDAASKRELGILRRLSAGVVAIGRKFISMNAEWLDAEEVVRITNEEFVKVRRDDLSGNFDLKLSISTAEEDEKKAQELAFMLQTMGNNMDIEITKLILCDIARLRKMPELAKKIEAYQPQPDPLQVQKAQLELTLLQAQIATEQAKAAHFGAGAQLAATKVGTETAKADHLRSDTDKKNLDFVEQESGVTQERDLQKQGAQADAQGKLKILEHHLNERSANNDAVRESFAAKKK